MDSLKIPPKKTYATPLRPVVTAASSTAAAVKPAIASQDRKHGQRVLLRIRASLQVVLQGKPTVLDAATLSVTPQGALVVTNRGETP